MQLACYVAMQLPAQCSIVNERVLSCTQGNVADSASTCLPPKPPPLRLLPKMGWELLEVEAPSCCRTAAMW